MFGQLFSEAVRIDSASAFIVNRNTYLRKTGYVLAGVLTGETALHCVELQPGLNQIHQLLSAELALQVNTAGVVGEYLDIEANLTTDILHLGEMIHETVVEVIHVGYDGFFEQYIYISGDGRSTCAGRRADGFSCIGIAGLEDISQRVFGTEVFHLPTELQDDIRFGHTCYFVKRRLCQFVAGLTDRKVVLHALLLDVLKRLLKALERELTLCHEVVDLGNRQLQTHVLLQRLFVIGHFGGHSHVLYFGVITVGDTPYIGRNHHQFRFLDLCARYQRYQRQCESKY